MQHLFAGIKWVLAGDSMGVAGSAGFGRIAAVRLLDVSDRDQSEAVAHDDQYRDLAATPVAVTSDDSDRTTAV